MVSIIIPYIDELDYLEEAVHSARHQLGVEVEIIVVCNGSSAAFPGHLCFKEEEGIIFIHEPTPGSAAARNTGLHAARGEWVQFLDVDDLLLPEKIFHQLQLQDADIVVSPHLFLFSDGHRESSRWMPDDIWTGLLNSGLGSTSSMLWKRLPLLQVGGWNKDWTSHQEYELLFRCLTMGFKVRANDHCETQVRQRETGSITTETKETRIKDGIRLREDIWKYLLSAKLDTPERFDAFRQYVFRQLRGYFRQERKDAMRIYKKYFTHARFTPEDIHVPGYKLLFRILGFEKTEILITTLLTFKRR